MMRDVVDLRAEQSRQLIDAEQLFQAYRALRVEYDRRFAGSMSWKQVRGHDYLYRKHSDKWVSLGARSAETEAAYASFLEGRAESRDRMAGLATRLDEMAPVNRAYGLGRMPVIAARILRALDRTRLMGTALNVVGTHALYAYERMAGVFIDSGHLATGDIDLLYDARARLRLLGTGIDTSGLAGLLKGIDRSFAPIGVGSFRAVNRDGFMVDLIQPLPKNMMGQQQRSRIGTDDGDLTAVEIEGLAWLVNSPKQETVVIDARGYPLSIITPDPRAFMVHKLWVSAREDRAPLSRRRDEAQARLVACLISNSLRHLAFDDPALGALPSHLRSKASALVHQGEDRDREEPLEPRW